MAVQSAVGEALGLLRQNQKGETIEIRGTDCILGMSLDIVFVLDVTSSMDPILERCKELILSFDKYILNNIANSTGRYCRQIRARIITYRDFYVEENKYALDASDFILLAENDKLYEEGQLELERRLNNITACGGGDEPESGLEALAMAMKSDWNFDGDKQRHIIVLFTDAPAHKLELIKECNRSYPNGPKGYPIGMLPESLQELIEAYNSDGRYGFSMDDDRTTRRLVLFAPEVYPWETLALKAEKKYVTFIKRGNGGKDIKTGTVADVLLRSFK